MIVQLVSFYVVEKDIAVQRLYSERNLIFCVEKEKRR